MRCQRTEAKRCFQKKSSKFNPHFLAESSNPFYHKCFLAVQYWSLTFTQSLDCLPFWVSAKHANIVWQTFEFACQAYLCVWPPRQALLDKHILLVYVFWNFPKTFFLLVTSKKCLLSTYLCSGQTDEHCAWRQNFKCLQSIVYPSRRGFILLRHVYRERKQKYTQLSSPHCFFVWCSSEAYQETHECEVGLSLGLSSFEPIGSQK